jgi:uncharacterized protein YbjT (DUF2867 family)
MTILVTGVRGGIGGRLARRLRDSGAAVRGTARDASAPGLPPGLDVVELDLAEPEPDPARTARALDGVEAVFLYPVRGGGIAGFLEAARAAGVGHVVLLSSPASFAAHEHDRYIGRAHRTIERTLEDSELPHTLLYPGWLDSNAARDWGEQIRRTARVALPYPDAQFTPIHLDDVAEVAALLLTGAAARPRIQVLTGPESLSQRELVAAIGEVTGRVLEVETIGRREALAGRPAWMPEAVLETLLAVQEAAVGVTAPVDNSVARLTGHPARSFRAWVEAHREAFLPDRD